MVVWMQSCEVSIPSLIPLQFSDLVCKKFTFNLHFFFCKSPTSLIGLVHWLTGILPLLLQQFWSFSSHYVPINSSVFIHPYPPQLMFILHHSLCNKTQENISGKFYFCKALSHRQNIREITLCFVEWNHIQGTIENRKKKKKNSRTFCCLTSNTDLSLFFFTTLRTHNKKTTNFYTNTFTPCYTFRERCGAHYHFFLNTCVNL